MASTAKVARFFEVSKKETSLHLTIAGMANSFGTMAFADHPPDPVFMQKFAAAFVERFKDRIMQHNQKVYADLFSDQEIDELIRIWKLPAMKKLIGFEAVINERVMEIVPALQEEVEKLYDDVETGTKVVSSH